MQAVLPQIKDNDILVVVSPKNSTDICRQLDSEAIRYCFLQDITNGLFQSQKTGTTGWNIDFESKFTNWINSLDSEINFWLNSVAKDSGVWHFDYKKRLSNTSFTALDGSVAYIAETLPDKATIMDIGCGLVTMFGSDYKEKKFHIEPVDPLAFVYEEINRKYANANYPHSKFGLFEFLSYFHEKEHADLIIINNALDHCIDPLKSILECLYVLKSGSVLHLSHRRCEALFENWVGLHQWNMDYNENNDFIMWNKDSTINVTKYLSSIADISLTHASENEPPETSWIRVDLNKKKDFVISDFYEKDNSCNMSTVMKIAMKKISDLLWEASGK